RANLHLMQYGLRDSGVGDSIGCWSLIYKPANTPDAILDPNAWQPLRVPDGQGGYKVQTCLAPHWGRVKAFSFNKPRRRRFCVVSLAAMYTQNV
ncbi:MAG: hypothetical protein P8Y45_09240, partial [Exilibacterium sp.]